MLIYGDEQAPMVLYAGYTLTLTFLVNIYLLAMAQLGKLVKPGSAGTLFGAFSLIGSLGMLFINKLGGYLYSEKDPIWPFIIVLISYCFLALAITICSLMKRLNV